ncbi:peptide methionine sulfoxide reductase [Halobacteriales archaeon QS_8_69_26]|nr:MAG: peptide methionine sulfoxide reductase [Halobacteriales archaeon QS_8_69_26]
MPPTPTVIEEYDRAAPARDETETATFGLGCFWGPDGRFGAMDGVVRTRVGYAGGTKRNPSYHALGDHTEVLQVDFDPDELTYRDVIDRVFRAHDPNRNARKPQYQNVVLAATDDQAATLESYLDDRGLDAGSIATRVETLSRFYPAEDYHQKHGLRAESPILDAFRAAGYDDEDLRESPAAAKLNGHAAGHDLSADHDALLARPSSRR